MPRRPLALLSLLALLLAACARGPSASPRLVRPDSDVITREQVENAAAANAYEVVQSLRPLWLRKRGAHSTTGAYDDVVVYLETTRFGGLQSLRQVDAASVRSIRFLDAATANYRWGPGHTHGVIQVFLLRGG